MRLPAPRATLGAKLALVLLAIVAGALAIVYLMVLPRLEDRLVGAKISELEQATPSLISQLRKSRGPVEFQDTVDFAATNLNARIVLLDPLDADSLRVLADSSFGGDEEVARDPVALRASRTLSPASGRLERGDGEFAEHARPVIRTTTSAVVLMSAPLDDALATVRLVRRSVLVAGLVALLASAFAAYAAARVLTRRLRRLESAAERIAAGDFTAPVEARGEDEIAELARGFDSMRVRLADLDRVRREFIANASHELRTPLFALGGFLELLDDEEVDPATRQEFLNETRAQVDRLTRLATDLLDLSRLDAGQLRVERGDVDLARAARMIGEEFRAVAEASGHPLSVERGATVLALADEQRVLQIARVLIENAIRHTPPGTPIAISASEADGRAALTVCDEGPGIPSDEQARLFDRFYRAREGKASGSGLGLSIAHELAKLMDGGIELRSEPGNTVFTLRLPQPAAAFSRENAELVRSA